MDELHIDDLTLRVAQDYVIDEDEERWVGEYWFLKSGYCLQIFQEPVHGYFIKLEKRELNWDELG